MALAQRAELARSRPVDYEQAVEPFLKTDGLSDSKHTMLMGGVCAKAYGWSPKKFGDW